MRRGPNSAPQRLRVPLVEHSRYPSAKRGNRAQERCKRSGSPIRWGERSGLPTFFQYKILHRRTARRIAHEKHLIETGLLIGSRPLSRTSLLPTGAGVPRLQENAPPSDPTVGLCLGSLGGLSGVGVFLWARYPFTQSTLCRGATPSRTCLKGRKGSRRRKTPSRVLLGGVLPPFQSCATAHVASSKPRGCIQHRFGRRCGGVDWSRVCSRCSVQVQ